MSALPLLLLTATLAITPTPLPTTPAAMAGDEQDVARALGRWRRAYAAGRITLHQAVLADPARAAIYDRGLPPEKLPGLTHEAGLRHLLNLAREGKPALAACQEVIQLAALGLGEQRIAVDQAPFRVRQLALSTLRQVRMPEVLLTLARTAEGDREPWDRKWRPELQAAALRGLGAPRRAVFRPILEKQLRAPEPLIRLAAADGLRHLAQSAVLPALGAAMQDERDGIVARGLVTNLHAVLLRHHAGPGVRADARDVRMAVQQTMGLLGKATWRTDLAIVDLLEDFRTVATIPALIGVLERFAARPDLVRSGALSTVLQHRAHEVLQSLTGAIHPIDRPEQWRTFWEQVQDDFVLAPPRERQTEPSRTVTAGFFGIPVQGSRVVFIIDTSGSMETRDARSREGETVSRLAAAKAELARAVNALPTDASFNVVFFAARVQRWRSDLTQATRDRKSALRHSLRRRNADGSTNLHGALVAALDIKSLLRGERYESNVDEIFLLSDGAPSSGAVTDTHAILALVRETNRHSGVRIHTIAMGSGAALGFMARLATENGGVHVNL